MGILQYADDTVLCFEHDIDKAINVKLLLYLFELMSGLKINFEKVKFSLLVEIMILIWCMQRCLVAGWALYL